MKFKNISSVKYSRNYIEQNKRNVYNKEVKYSPEMTTFDIININNGNFYSRNRSWSLRKKEKKKH
jgi:hypothetical protein